MKKLLLFIGLLWAAGANAQFTPGQLLTAGELNTQFALYSKLAGATFTGPVTIPTLTVSTTATLPSQAANTLLGNTSGSSASPSAVSVGNCSSSSSALSYTSGTGFGCNSSVNAATLGGATFAAPGPIGSTTPSTGSFTNLSSNGTLTLANGSVTLPYLATEAANTVVANFTGSTASPVAFSMPSCAGSSNALGYTSGTGIVCNSTINASSLGGTAAASYALLASPTFTGTPAAPTASATTNTTQIATTAMVNSAITGNNLAGSFTTLTASSTITPSQTAGIVGTNTNNNANTGSVGEFITNTVTGTSLTSNTAANCSSISLTAGDWDVWGSVAFLPAASTTISSINSGVNTTSATLPSIGNYSALNAALTTGVGQNLVAPIMRESLTSTTTIYMVGLSVFGASTMTCNGTISARRRR